MEPPDALLPPVTSMQASLPGLIPPAVHPQRGASGDESPAVDTSREPPPEGTAASAIRIKRRRGCGQCLNRICPGHREQLADILHVVVRGKAGWTGTRAGLGAAIFFGSPFLIQFSGVVAIFVTGTTTAVVVSWIVFMFVNVCCLLPGHLQQKCKTRTKSVEVYASRTSEKTAPSVSDGQVQAKLTREAHRSVGKMWGFVWIYTALLTLAPASLIAYADGAGELAELGVGLYVLLLWAIGWLYMWYHAGSIETIQRRQRLLNIPPDIVVGGKLLTIMVECYYYCGFSFLPAVPWTEMGVPQVAPRPENVMMAGFFEFEDAAVQRVAFQSACIMTILGVLMVVATRHDLALNMIAIQVVFDMMAFPVIQKLTGVLACTSQDKYRVVYGGQLVRACQLTVDAPTESSCMDEAPDVLCWSQDHLIWYIIPAVFILGPYYCACVEMLSKSQARQSVVVIDRICGLISFQGKFILAVLGSAVDDCHPWILVSSALVIILVQLALIVWDRDYTSVLVLNAVRVGGLGMATVNGIFAAFVTFLYSDAASRTACQVLSDSGSSESGSSDILAVEIEENATFAAGDSSQPGPRRSYGVFLGLIAANALAAALAVWWYRWKKRTWVPSPEEIRESADEFQVDYSMLKRRLELVAEELSGRSDTQETLSYEDFKVGFDAGVLYSRAQCVWSWVDSSSQGSVGTNEITKLHRALGDSNEFDGWECPEISTVEEVVGLVCGHESRVDEDQYFTRLQDNPQLLREVQKWFAVLNQRLGLLPTKVSDERELKLLRILSGTRQAQPDGGVGELSVTSSSIHRFRDGFRQGMAWCDIYTDWDLDSTLNQLVSYWHETPSEQAWSKYNCLSLYVSEYSDTQDPAMIQLWENVRAASNLNGNAGIATSHRSERSEYYSGDAPSSTELWRVRRSALKSSAVQHTSSESLSQLDSLLKRRDLHRAASWVKDLIQEASQVSIQDSLNALEDVNMVEKLARLSSTVATDDENTTNRASGQQMEAATLRMVLHKTADNKFPRSTRSTREHLTSAELHSAAIQSSDIVAAHRELCREGSRFGMKCLRSICDESTVLRPNDQFVTTWRIRLNICDVDLSTVGGLELIDMLKEIHVNCTRATSTARISRCVLREKHGER